MVDPIGHALENAVLFNGQKNPSKIAPVTVRFFNRECGKRISSRQYKQVGNLANFPWGSGLP